MTATDIIRRASIDEICAQRAVALQLYTEVVEKLQSARAAHQSAALGKSSFGEPDLSMLRYGIRDERFLQDIQKKIDADIWESLLDRTQLRSLMDAQEMRKFRDSLQNPVPVTPETVYATLNGLRGQSWNIFKRGILKAFGSLCRDYKSHDGFKIGKRLVLTYGVSYNGYWTSLRSDDTLMDIDRIFHVLDAKPAPDYQQGICAAIRAATNVRPMEWEATTPYFRAKWYKKGTLHLYPLRPDLVQKANQIIADHYGATLGAAPDVADRRRGPIVAAPAPDDFYETPYELVQQMVSVAEIEAGHRVLEPSAGEGAIASEIARIADVGMVCIEYNRIRVEHLRRRLDYAKIIQGDFLDKEPSPSFDRILMNPPFSRGLDVLHVHHALDFMAPGGKLVAIMAGNALSRQNGRSQDLLRHLDTHFTWRAEALPSGSFREAGTMVSTIMLVASKLDAGISNGRLL